MGSPTWSAQAFLVQNDLTSHGRCLDWDRKVYNTATHTHTHTHTHMHPHAHHTHTHARTHTHTHTHVHMHTYTHHWHHHHTTPQAGTHMHTPHASISLFLSQARTPHTHAHIHACMHTSSLAHARSFIKGNYWMSSVCVFCCLKICRGYANSRQSMCCSDSWSWSVLYWTEDPLSQWR